jgi:hypothetical protein
MPTIIVVPAEKGRFKVLVNYIQRGIEYATQELAEREANKIRQQYNEVVDARINNILGR